MAKEVDYEINEGDKVTLKIDKLSRIHCEVYSESDEEVLLGFWLPKAQLTGKQNQEKEVDYV